MNWFVLISIVLAAPAMVLRAEPPTTRPAEAPRILLYAAIVRPGPAWLENKAAGRPNDMTRHAAYVSTLRSAGKLVLGGPFADGTGGLLVYRADSLEQATALIQSDPAYVEKLFEFDIHPWLLNAADLPIKQP